MAYLLLDEGAIVSDPAWSDQMRKVAATLFRLEQYRDEQDMLEVLGTLVEWLKAPEQTGLRRAFVVWIRRVLLPSRAPEMELPEFTALQDLHELAKPAYLKNALWSPSYFAGSVGGAPISVVRQYIEGQNRPNKPP